LIGPALQSPRPPRALHASTALGESKRPRIGLCGFAALRGKGPIPFSRKDAEAQSSKETARRQEDAGRGGEAVLTETSRRA
jgi:hypothetical protein